MTRVAGGSGTDDLRGEAGIDTVSYADIADATHVVINLSNESRVGLGIHDCGSDGQGAHLRGTL